jgi:hypothetical protein
MIGQLLQQHFYFVWSTGLDAGSVILCDGGIKLAEGRFKSIAAGPERLTILLPRSHNQSGMVRGRLPTTFL